MTTLWQDIVYGCRMLASKPGFTAAAVLSLALGIGANSTIFSFINSTLLAGLPYPEPDRLDIVWSAPLNRPDARSSVTAKNYRAWLERSQSFAALGGSFGFTSNLGGESDGSPAEQLEGRRFTWSMWNVLGVQPVLGRVFTEEEDQDLNGAPVIVLSYPFWQRRYGGDKDVIGQTVVLDNIETTIIGVMPEGFDFTSDSTDFWAPAGFSRQQLDSAASFLLVTGRLKPGVTEAQAQSEMAAVAAGLAREFPERNQNLGARVQGLRDALFQGVKEPLFVLQGAVAFVLLIACANVAGLLLARAGARQPEMAVRAALGAGRGRIVRQLLTESTVLALAGGVLGCGIAWAGLRGIVAALPPGILGLTNASLDARVLAFTAAASLATGLLFGLAPALQTSKVDLSSSLKESGRTGMDAGGRQRVRSVLVTAQIALALVLLIGAGLMMNSFTKLQSNDLGADPENLLTFEFRFPQSQLMRPVGTYQGVGLWEIFPITGLTNQRVYERLQAVPGVISAAALSRAPMSGAAMGAGFRIEGRPAPEPGQNGGGMNAVYFAATPHYFDTMKIPLLSGRDFTDKDTAGAPPVVIISKAMADRWWPNENPLGQRITLDFVPDEPVREIVGVVGDTRLSRYQRQFTPTVYVPHLQQTTNWRGPMWDYRAMMVFVLRTQGDPMSLVPAVRAAVGEIDPSKPAGNIRTVEQYLGQQTQGDRLYMLLISIFGVVAAVLAAVGIYGVMAYAVAQRTREIGIRMALGASGANVMRLVVRGALVLIAVGMVIGLAGAFALTRFLQNDLYNVSATDPVTFTVVSVGLAVVAVIACLVPTRRAVGVDPTIALRYE